MFIYKVSAYTIFMRTIRMMLDTLHSTFTHFTFTNTHIGIPAHRGLCEMRDLYLDKSIDTKSHICALNTK